MSAPALGARGAVASALSAVAGWLVEPIEPGEVFEHTRPVPGERAVVAVMGLGAGCGATVVARALGAELAARDHGGACVVTAAASRGAVALGLPAAGRLARSLTGVPGISTRACGRLCLADCSDKAALAGTVLYRAPLVFDIEESHEAPIAAALADSVVLVAAPRVEPALAAVMAESLGRIGTEPVTVLNRASVVDSRWVGRAGYVLPDSRVGAQLAVAGREPRGEFGRSITALADAVGGAR